MTVFGKTHLKQERGGERRIVTQNSPLCVKHQPIPLWHQQTASPVTSSTSGPRECPDDWTEFSGACYLHQRTLVSWYGAAYECEALGSVLTSVLSREEEQFINKLAAGTGLGTFHLGGYIANTWKWLDGSPVTVIHSVTLT